MNSRAPAQLSALVIACLAATWLIWGSTYLAIRYALLGFAPFFLMGTRFLCAGVLLFAWQMLQRAAWPSWREWRNGAIIGALMLGLGMGGTAYSEQTIASGLVVSFIAVVPLMLVVINLAFGVYPRPAEIIAVLVGLAGVVMLTQGTGMHSSPAGLTAIAIGCTGWSLGSVLSQRSLKLAPGASGFATELLCGGGVLLLMSLAAGEPWRIPTQGVPIVAWVYLMSFGSLIAFNAYMVLLARAPVSLASSYTFVNPIVALLLGVTLGKETISPWEWTAAAIVTLGVVLLVTTRSRT